MNSSPHTPIHVLVVDDEESIRFTVNRFLTQAGFTVTCAQTYDEAIDSLSRHDFTVAVIDRVLGNGHSGIEIIKNIPALTPFCQSIIMTGFPSFESAAETIRYKTFAYITKPIKKDEICAVVEEAARESIRKKEVDLHHSLFSSVFGASPNPIMFADMQGTAIFVNPAFVSTFGFMGEGLNCFESPFVPEDDLEHTRSDLSSLLKGSQIPERETVRHTSTGEAREVTVSLSLCRGSGADPTGVLIIIRDITEEKKKDRELIQAEKMSVVGQLSSKLAHEINNPVQVIMGHTDLLLLDENLDDQPKKQLGTIRDAAQVIKNLNNDLMEVARPRPLKPSEFAPHEPIDRAIEFLNKMGEIKYYRVIRNYEPDLPPVRGDFQQLNQVFINLIMNASHAMKHSREKILYFGASRKAENGHLTLTVGDTGSGIAPEQRDHIFDPFFTTRRAEGGTGLGLAVVKSIVERHGGTIELTSEPGTGSTFTMTLPAVQ